MRKYANKECFKQHIETLMQNGFFEKTFCLGISGFKIMFTKCKYISLMVGFGDEWCGYICHYFMVCYIKDNVKIDVDF